MSRHGTALLILVGSLVGLGAMGGCSDDDDALPAPAAAGDGGAAGGSASGAAGANPKVGGASGGGGAGAGAGGAITCDCGSDVDAATIPLDCARALGLASTFESDLNLYQNPNRFGWPYYVLLGTCAAGYRTLSFGEALEQDGLRAYDANGDMVYDWFGGYDGRVPDACGFDEEFSLGSVTVGTYPAQDCSYCLLAGHDEGAGGAGGDGGSGGSGGADTREPIYPASSTRPCEASDLE
jgi:hypothetical protein